MSNGEWEEQPPYCVRRKSILLLPLQQGESQADCTEYQQLEHASWNLVNDDPNGVLTVRYECEDGFTAIGRQQIRCIPGIGWEPLQMECNMLKCGSPGIPLNGFITSLDFRYGSSIAYGCLDSHTLQGPASRTCSVTSGMWDNQVPTCQPQLCSSPTIVNGDVSYDNEALFIGNLVSFECHRGYVLIGYNSTECLDDLTWSNDIPVCEVIQCERPEIVSAGLDIVGSRDVFDFGENIAYECQNKRFHKLHGSASRQCVEGGQWTGEEPSCHAFCRSLPSRIPNGASFNTPSDTMYNWHSGQKVYYCNELYRLTGTSNIVCHNGRWSSNELPSCVDERDINMPPIPIRSMTHAIINGVLEVNQRDEEVQIDCRVSTFQGIPEWRKDPNIRPEKQYALRLDGRGNRWYRLRLNNIAQSDTGDYRCTTIARSRSSAIRISVIPTCEDPGNQEGRLASRDTAGGVRAGQTGFVRFTCEQGYDMVGDHSQLGCDVSGNWNHEPPDCVKRNCRDAYLSDPTYGYTSVTYLSPDGTWASQTFQCYSGYTLNGDTTVLDMTLGCLNGVWNGTTPSCRLRANSIQITSDGSMIPRDITYNARDTLVLNCIQSQAQPTWSLRTTDGDVAISPDSNDVDLQDEFGSSMLRFSGLQLENQGIYVCSSNLEEAYSELVQLTVLASCLAPTPDPNGYIIQSTVQDLYYESDEIEFACIDGFVLHGEGQTVCRHSGWSSSVPQCIQDLNLSVYMEGNILAEGSQIVAETGSHIFLDCTLEHNNLVHLSESDVIGWSKLTPGGDRIDMSVHQLIVEDGNLTYLRLALADVTREFNGRYGCGSDAQSLEVECLVIVPCAPPDALTHGSLVVTGDGIQAIVSYTCRDLYTLVNGDSQRQCQPNGEWSGSAPECSLAYCPTLSIPATVNVLPDLADQPFPIGTTLTFNCSDDMSPSGLQQLSCMDDGTWYPDGQLPNCIDPCNGFECRLGWKCVVVDGQPECNGCMTENDCNFQYSIGTVCGSDANDYISECILGVTACINQDLALQKVYDGKCAQGSLCFLGPTVMDRESLPCPQPNMMFYFNPDTTVLSCQVIKADECLLQGGFTSMVDCQEKCLRNYCNDPPGEHGPCDQDEEYWTYNSETKQCQSFMYGGCSSRINQNRFPTINDCLRSCQLGEVCQPCPETMTLDNACFFGKHAQILTVTSAQRFPTVGFIRFSVNVQNILTPPRDGLLLETGPGQNVYCEGTYIEAACTCPRLTPLVDQSYLFVSSSYRNEYLKLDNHSFVSEWTDDLRLKVSSLESCRDWIL
ncbi:sushi, von Willebrand factor type A, EGF and pentraxin domain-containing protein 1-like [Asterias amurensis]|uniref:sushi, von Willebrand factor type A, EGF and pentraxin domain-containing protein 1-like n=1 Tax=Asterias amurensis TaxID=7602 RepID=UPI003AB3D67E